MPADASDSQLDRLLEAAFEQTLEQFRREVKRGERDPSAERESYRRRRRDYASLLRMERVPDEARELAGHLLHSHGLELEPGARRDFERDVTRLLIRLYDAFLAGVSSRINNQGSR